MNICIGGDLDGRIVDFKKGNFKASEVEKGKISEYRKQIYIFDDNLYYFWISSDVDLNQVRKRIEFILQKTSN